MHGNLDGLDPSGHDVCVIAGDFAKLTGFGKWHVVDQRKWVEKKFFDFVGSFPDIQFVVTPGNHDLFADPKYSLAWPDVRLCVKWPENVHFLLNSGCEIDGIRFWGSPNVPIISYSWAFESERDTLRMAFAAIPRDIGVLVTHTPPRIPDEFVDYSLQTRRGPFGSPELTDAIAEKSPKLVFCGHIHSGRHDPVRFGYTTVYNVSRVDENYEIAYEPATVEL